ncbi:MAG: fatty acyl-AMP ligase, partial [Rhodococcus sp.]|nr:fatty acyl-AMP ligase [Rhodococcus sp. (in: high G+C Gram-positive bacteria)]
MNNTKDIATVCGWIDHPVADRGIHLADEVDGWDYCSYPDLADLTRRMATILRERGLQPGEGVCVVMPTGFTAIAAFYGVWAAGGVFTPVSPPLLGGMDQYIVHVAAILDQAQPRLLVTSPDLAHLVQTAVDAQSDARSEIVVVDPDVLRSAPPIDELITPTEAALLQFTSGSTGIPRGVRISWANLATNIDIISRLVRWEDGDAMASWLPLYHDMGLVGTFLADVTKQGNLYLMRPDQFVRNPLRWLRAMQHAQHTASPSFALGYAAHRVRPEDLEGVDLSGWRTLAVGSEPIDVSDLQQFYDLTAPAGFPMEAFTLAYGLAEATLLVTSSHRGEPITALQIDSTTLRVGERVDILDESPIDPGFALDGGGWVTGLGYSTPEARVRIVDEDGAPLPDGTLGEVVVAGDSVSAGYHAVDDGHTFVGGELYTADSGFLWKGQLFVLGRLGTSLKVRGRSVFMEDVESRLLSEV